MFVCGVNVKEVSSWRRYRYGFEAYRVESDEQTEGKRREKR